MTDIIKEGLIKIQLFKLSGWRKINDIFSKKVYKLEQKVQMKIINEHFIKNPIVKINESILLKELGLDKDSINNITPPISGFTNKTFKEN